MSKETSTLGLTMRPLRDVCPTEGRPALAAGLLSTCPPRFPVPPLPREEHISIWFNIRCHVQGQGEHDKISLEIDVASSQTLTPTSKAFPMSFVAHLSTCTYLSNFHLPQWVLSNNAAPHTIICKREMLCQVSLAEALPLSLSLE